MMMRGAGGRSAEEISRALDDRGARMSVSSGNNSLYASATALSEDLPEVMAVLADVLWRPAFPEKELAARRQLQIAAIRRSRDSLHASGMRVLRENAFPGHPYARHPLGTEASVGKITRADLAAMRKRLIGADNMVLVCVGDIEPAAVLELVRKHFGDLPPADAADLRKAMASGEGAGPMTVRQPIPKEMAIVYYGYPAVTINNTRDRAALEILDAITSGIRLPRGWLHKELRGRQLVYEVHAYTWQGFLDPGLFVIYAVCQPEKIEQVRAIIPAQMARAREHLPAKDELELARKVAATARELELQTNGDQALDMALNELYGLGYDFAGRYRKALLAVTAEEVRRVARKYLANPVEVILSRDVGAAPDK